MGCCCMHTSRLPAMLYVWLAGYIVRVGDLSEDLCSLIAPWVSAVPGALSEMQGQT